MELTPETQQLLIRKAIEGAEKAYCPYSKYPVGAAILAGNGNIYVGCNIENASYPVTLCAERCAIAKMVSDGEHTIKAIACVTRDCGLPCGMCRQCINEFGHDCTVICATISGELKGVYKLPEVLPHAFGPQNLLD